jgi:hypothetical protein
MPASSMSCLTQAATEIEAVDLVAVRQQATATFRVPGSAVEKTCVASWYQSGAVQKMRSRL